MILRHIQEPSSSPIATRLSSLGALTAGDIEALAEVEADRLKVRPRGEIHVEGRPVTGGWIVASGWACQVRHYNDGRRQILGLLLPGDIIGMHRHAAPLAMCDVVALTDVSLIPAPVREGRPGLAEVYDVDEAIREALMLRHIARLGRLNAYERLADWMLETERRLAAAGLVAGNRFAMPLTQEVLADTLGLTSVHVNRTLQVLRREGSLDVRGGFVSVLNRERLVAAVDYRTVSVGG